VNKVVSITAGLILGAAFGAGLVLLVAPRSGAETQQLIRDRLGTILAEGQQAADTRRLELSERFEALKQPGGAQQST
jgi:gas vesicle protein